MRRPALVAIACAIAASVFAAPALAVPEGDAGIVEIPISFDVTNSNRTPVTCQSDGNDYTVRGTLVAPRAALDSGDAATLYLHAVTWGAYYWNLDIEGYDYARQMAERGHVSVAVDRLGYGDSDRPPGKDTCFGSEADVAGQMVDALRTGDYRLDGEEPTAFDKVFIAGSSVGGMTAQITAYSFGNVDGVFNMAWGDFAASPYAGGEVADVTLRCAMGGDAGAPPDYATFAKDTRETFYFNSAEPEVRAAVPALNPDPCGQLGSLPAGIGADVANLGEIDVPVLVMFGDADAVFPPPAADQQALRYTGSPEVTKVIIPGASHYPLVEANHLQVVDAADEWLTRHGG
jgi:pimeloyl-ACP methyl ester carboxylesterase